MGLASQLSHLVDSHVRSRGAQYFRDGRVALVYCISDEAVAEVEGSADEPYKVVLTRQGKRLKVSCSCPYFEDHGCCKHIWATILAADARGGLRGTGGSMPRRLVALEDEESTEVSRPPATSVRNREKPGRNAAWRALLDGALPGPPPPPAVTGEILYVIDLVTLPLRGQLRVELWNLRPKLDGTPGRPRELRLARAALALLPEAADSQILALLAGGMEGGIWSSFYGELPSAFDLPEAVMPLLVPLLCATGRCHVRAEPEPRTGVPLSWDDGEPWALRLEVGEIRGGTLELRAALRRGEERLEPPYFLTSGDVLFKAGTAARHCVGRTGGLLQALHERPLRVPAADRDEALARLLTAEDFRVDLPERLRIEEVAAAPRPRLRLRRAHGLQPFQEQPRAELSFVYDGTELTADAASRGVYQPHERRLLLRDRAAERRAGERLREVGFQVSEDGPRIAPGKVAAAVRALLAEDWQVEAEGKLYRPPGQFRLAVASGVDWFDLTAEADFGGRSVHLPALLAALRRNDGLVPLGDGSFGFLPEEWARRLAPLADFGRVEEKGPAAGRMRFATAQAPLLDALLAEQPEVSFDEAFGRARERLRSFAGVAPAAPPAGFTGTLRGYQQVGLGWLHFLRDFGFGGCLADDMGLGKTVQVLALLAARAAEGAGPTLAVVPRSLVFNWTAEAARFAPGLRIRDHTGTGRAKGDDAFAGCDLVLTTYGTLRRDIGALSRQEFDYVILDEAQAIKNADSQTAKCARLLRGRHRLALTGTPLENHLGELWSLLEFLNPGLLGAGALAPARAAGLRDPDPATRALLGKALRPFLLRRTKEEVATDLPAKMEQTLFCELPAKQRKLYDELRDHYRAALGRQLDRQGLAQSRIQVLEALLRLRQAACHPGLLDPARADEPTAKLDVLLPQLREIVAEGHKVLVFSQFTRFLALVRKQLEQENLAYLYLDGRTRDRQEKVERFQTDPKVPVFLISLKAGGVGLNLTAADYVYLLDPWWNPAVEAQAIDRTHRIGQTRPVIACRLVARNTVEEKILELQSAKRELADAILRADGGPLASLSREDLEWLLT
jgi:superfamily II DNA or RNA helicase